MADIPEHLLERARQARERLTGVSSEPTAAPADEAPAAEAEADATAAAAAVGDATSGDKIPAHLLDRTTPATAAPATATATALAEPPAQLATNGSGGTTQRLLTVVKSGSIQDVKTLPSDKVHVWPHLLIVEFVAALFVTAFLLVFSIFVNAPLLELANFNETTNPSKAPWYFLGLQELLTMFHPMVAGVTIPGMGIFLLILAPYIDRNPDQRPERRKFAVSLMTIHLMFWAILVIIGSFFRGPGFNFVFPWEAGLFFDF